MDLPVNYDETQVPAYILPNPLRFGDGSPVEDTVAWSRRRTEIIDLFADQVYGRLPGAAPHLHWKVTDDSAGVLDGLATRRQVSIYFSQASTVRTWICCSTYPPDAADRFRSSWG